MSAHRPTAIERHLLAVIRSAQTIAEESSIKECVIRGKDEDAPPHLRMWRALEDGLIRRDKAIKRARARRKARR